MEVGQAQVLQKVMQVMQVLQVLQVLVLLGLQVLPELVLLGLHWVQELSSRCHKNILLVYPRLSHQAYKICHIGHN